MGMFKKGVEAANRTSFAGAPPAVMKAANYSAAAQVAKKGFGGVPDEAIKDLEAKADAAKKQVELTKKKRGLLASGAKAAGKETLGG